tara:strand:+ start:13831 stop:14220 length:390 start_codon:yes stop_codon:yes gene_type:complete
MINSIDFLTSAKAILASTQEEVGFRNSISRAYYSAYHACLEVLVSLDIEVTDEDCGAHLKTIKALKRNGSTHYIGKDLADLKTARTRADYFINNRVTKRDAEQTIHRAEMLIKDINQLYGQQEELASES